MASQPVTHVTPEEYLRLEREAETKHEYIDGEMVAMAGGSPRHALITSNISAALNAAPRGSDCLVFSPDLRVCVRWNRLFTYPDVVVLCGEPRYADDRRDTITNPVVVVEVLSPSTRNFDRGDKAFLYRSLESIREYLLVDPDTIGIEHYRRIQGDRWELIVVTDPASTLVLHSVNCELPVGEIYRGVERLS